MKAKVINLIGGPGTGKSTAMAGIFYNLKKLGINCEMVTEYVKDKVWGEEFKTMDDQLYCSAKYYHKIWRVADKVDYVITDSSLLTGIFYNKEPSDNFTNLILFFISYLETIHFFRI